MAASMTVFSTFSKPNNFLKPSPAEPGYALALQCRSRSAPTDLDLHCLSLRI